MRVPLISILMLFSAPVSAHAVCPPAPPTGTECVAYGAEKSITPAGQACRKVRNLDITGQDLFVPVSSGQEWLNFLSYLPAGVSASACMICSPGQAQGCGSIANGYGLQYCSGDGMGWSGCSYACNPGYEMRSGSCQLPMVCSPYSTQYCSALANATCTQQCAGDGMGWGGCGNCSCNPGFVWRNGACQAPLTWQEDSSCLRVANDASISYSPANAGEACSTEGQCIWNHYKQVLLCK